MVDKCILYSAGSLCYSGREFVLGFMENRIIVDYPVARIYISTCNMFGHQVAHLHVPSENDQKSIYWHLLVMAVIVL